MCNIHSCHRPASARSEDEKVQLPKSDGRRQESFQLGGWILGGSGPRTDGSVVNKHG